MKVKCFECDVVIEADDVEAVEEAFVGHGRDVHAWTYPEKAIRNYARNNAEAPARLTGSTERLAEIGEVTVLPVTSERVADWLQLFDHDAFPDNPDFASCYCLEPYVPAPPEEPERAWREARAAVAGRLREGMAFGYLAYVGGKAVGWVNAALRSHYGLYKNVDPNGPAPASVIGVSCFVVAPPYRRHGVAAALLDFVIADAPARGAAWVEGYPRNTPEDSAAGRHFRGPRSMYDARGFMPIEVRERDTVVRLSTAPR